ncbi:MAG: DnaJ domain-containing protein [Planctomycetaceae bacterium]|nr:DnaJ domain-containing protein [Planctomycetaceae bacterium]
MNSYKILGVAKNASQDEIKSAYRKKAAKYHPDRGGDAWAFQQVQEAFDVLAAEEVEDVEQVQAEPNFVPAVNTGSTKTHGKTLGRRRRKKARNELVGIVLGGVLALVVGSVFWLWWESQSAVDPRATQSAKAATTNGKAILKRQPRRMRTKPNIEAPKKSRNLGLEDNGEREIPNSGAKDPEKAVASLDGINREVEKKNVALDVKINPRVTRPTKKLEVAMRKWNDSSDQFSKEARLHSIEDSSVVLVNVDGNELVVPLDRLSEADRKYAERFPTLLAREYGRIEKELRFAEIILRYYKEVLASGNVLPSEAAHIKSRIDAIEQVDKPNLVLFEGEFLSWDVVQEKRQNADKLIDEWYELILISDLDTESKAFQLAQTKIREAKQSDPSSFRADFYLGIVNALVLGDFERSEKRFDDAMERAKSYQAIHNSGDTRNMAHLYNNLALLAVRESKLKRARDLWLEMNALIESTKINPEAAHNIAKVGLFIEASDRDSRKSLLRGTTKDKNEFLQWKLQFFRTHEVTGSGSGWLFLPYVLPEGYPRDGVPPKTDANLIVYAEDFFEREGLFSELNDSACFVCAGTGRVGCGNPKCKRGRVKQAKKWSSTDPTGRWSYSGSKPSFTKCPTCSGKSTVKCWCCGGSRTHDY